MTQAMPVRWGRTAFLPLIGNRSGSPVARPRQCGADRTDQAQRRPRSADGGPEIHQRLGPVAGAIVGDERPGQTSQLRLGPRQRGLDREQPGHDPLDIAVHDIGRAVEGDRRHGRRRIGARRPAGSADPASVSGNTPPWSFATARAQASRLRARA